ncbi:MAG: hypothetical protein ACR2PR_11900 [Pseudohongiellaceae bacterium]
MPLNINVPSDLARRLQDYSLLVGHSRDYLLRRALLEYFDELEAGFLREYPEAAHTHHVGNAVSELEVGRGGGI